jgi:hypothetical protein
MQPNPGAVVWDMSHHLLRQHQSQTLKIGNAPGAVSLAALQVVVIWTRNILRASLASLTMFLLLSMLTLPGPWVLEALAQQRAWELQRLCQLSGGRGSGAAEGGTC